MGDSLLCVGSCRAPTTKAPALKCVWLTERFGPYRSLWTFPRSLQKPSDPALRSPFATQRVSCWRHYTWTNSGSQIDLKKQSRFLARKARCTPAQIICLSAVTPGTQEAGWKEFSVLHTTIFGRFV